MTSNSLTKADLDKITPTEERFQHVPIGKVSYTEGIKYLADAAEAEWLITQLAFAQTHRNVAAEEFQEWTLTVNLRTGTAILLCKDKDQKTVFTRTIEYTNFPLSEIRLYVIDNVMMLANER